MLPDWENFLSTAQDIKLIFFLGRSNVGKSSLINFLFNHKHAHVSQTPGKTKLINVFDIKSKNQPDKSLGALIDLPGYGHARISKAERAQWDDLMAKMFDTLDTNCHLFCLQDARHPFSDMDLILLDYLAHYPAAKTLILTKMDQCKTQADRHKLKKLVTEFSKSYHFENCIEVSKEDSKSILKLQSYLKQLLE